MVEICTPATILSGYFRFAQHNKNSAPSITFKITQVINVDN